MTQTETFFHQLNLLMDLGWVVSLGKSPSGRGFQAMATWASKRDKDTPNTKADGSTIEEAMDNLNAALALEGAEMFYGLFGEKVPESMKNIIEKKPTKTTPDAAIEDLLNKLTNVR